MSPRHNDLELSEITRIQTTGRVLVAVIGGVVGLAFGLGVSYATVRSDVTNVREAQVQQAREIMAVAKDVKTLGTKVDTLIGYQTAIGYGPRRPAPPVSDESPPPQ